MTLNLVPLLREKWPGHDVDYYCHPSIGAELKDLLLAVGVAKVGDSSRLDASGYFSVFNLVGYPLHEGYPEKPMRHHLLDYFAKELGLDVDPAALPSLRLRLPPRPAGPSGPYATLQAKTGWSAYKNWPIACWAEVVAACPEIPIYQIGTSDEPRVDGARHDFMGSPLSTSIALVANAALHLGLDSFANHLTHYFWEDGSSARRVPAVILWGSTQVDASGYDHNTNISLGLSCQPCFREDPAVSRMPRGPCINPPEQSYAEPRHACMLGIDPERVTCEVKVLWMSSCGERMLRATGER
jgi:ADP-heptose:LPS heptosyltransferase